MIEPLAPTIHHIGSTAVVGFAAKPVIDILIEIERADSIDAYNSKTYEIGYITQGELGVAGRRFFQKVGDNRTHHVHIFSAGDPCITRHIAFRDYLRTHPKIAKEYATLKRVAASESNNDIDRYQQEKDVFVKVLQRLAEAWAST
ncbi:MAG: GrpB-like predicted nucleotidyltransferase (UPF0157 family) [Chitinophagales bacterium]|jgi:GrpB-like predicted nucleotidyltransferase (UPF0157 family)